MELRAEQGTLLAATPEMLDPNFMHTVVLVCQHAEEGAFGLVLNRRSEFTTRQVLSEHPVLGTCDQPVYIGGPVGLNQMQILHRVPDAIHGSAELFEGVWIGGELDDVARFVAEEPERARVDLRLFIGYSGWSGGQLDGELAHGSWLPAPGSAIEIFAPDPSGVWREVMRSLGADWQGLDAQPPDPRWN